ncbi:unnamed protein product [Macrosiphum euphorbiae]|nr:unnamed protein product [Macrosiphum euphorbiae]
MGMDYELDNDDIPQARNALVFLVVGLNGYWKLPIGYFLIDSLNGTERSNLLKTAIDLVKDTGAYLKSVTFDGTNVNTTMCTSLGANFNLDSNTAFFSSNHSKDEKVFCFYDPSHMIKLVRNAFGDKKTIVNGNGQKIRWDYIQKLYQKENCEGLRAATKLTNRHLHYYNEKMNVRLAAQVPSNSVCDALLYLNGSDPNFEGSLATAEFCLIFNNAFDILNSRKQLSNKPFNNSINENTFEKNIVIF